MNTQLALVLPSSASLNTVIINARCTLRVQEDQRVIVVGGLPVHHYRSDDAVAEAYAMVLLVDSGFAQQTEVGRAFGKSERTVRRQQERYAQAGMVGLGREVGWRRGRRRISGKRLRSIEILKSHGLSNRAIAQRLGVNEKAIRKLVGPSKAGEVEQFSFAASPRNPPTSQPQQPRASSTESIEKSADEQLADQPPMPNDPANEAAVIDEHAEDSEPVPMSLDHDGSDRTFDRQLAYESAHAF